MIQTASAQEFPVSNAFLPTSITGSTLWLDGADPAGTGILPANGATVSTWADKSGNARNSPANTTGAVFAANSLNGKGTINFTAQGRYYVTPNFIPSSTNAPSIFVVAQQTGYTSGNSEIVIATVGSPTWATFDLFGSGGTFIAKLNMYNNQGENGGISISSPAIISIVGSGSPSFSASMFGNGTLNITFTGSGTNPMSVSMGFNIGSSAGFIGNIYEVIMYNTSLSTLQRQQVEGYLAWKWGLQANLPADHPYKSAAPTGSSNARSLIVKGNPPTVFPLSIQLNATIKNAKNPVNPVIINTNLVENLDASTYISGSTWTALVGNNYLITGTFTKTSTPGGSTAIVLDGSSYAQDQTGITSSTLYLYTLDLWFYSAAGQSASIVGEGGQQNIGGWNVTVISVESNTVSVGFWIGGVYRLSVGSYTANTWTHVAYSYNNTTGAVIGYLNGQRVATGTATKQWPTTIFYTTGGGMNPFGNFTGQIGAFKVYNTVLTDAQVNQNYNALRSRFGL